jgi:hypothetical protein
MFEEVPRERRGLSRLMARGVVLGPFMIGGGVALAALGGSVAVAATVITASTIGFKDLGPHHSGAAAPARTTASNRLSVAASATRASTAAHWSATAQQAQQPWGGAETSVKAGSAGPAATTVPSSNSRSSVASSSSSPKSTAPSVPSPAQGSPNGNAIIFVTGYDSGASRIRYRYAHMQPGAGAGGSDMYIVDAGAIYSAGLAEGLQITSGRTICPPAGASCAVQQLIDAASQGFFAEAAIDSAGNLRSVIERDNVAQTASPDLKAAPAPSATATSAAPSPG